MVSRALVFLIAGLALCVLGVLTATDAISLRAASHDVPVLSTLVLATRLDMGSRVAHALEPASAVIGAGVTLLAAALLRWSAPSRIRTGDLSLERAAS